MSSVSHLEAAPQLNHFFLSGLAASHLSTTYMPVTPSGDVFQSLTSRTYSLTENASPSQKSASPSGLSWPPLLSSPPFFPRQPAEISYTAGKSAPYDKPQNFLPLTPLPRSPSPPFMGSCGTPQPGLLLGGFHVWLIFARLPDFGTPRS